MDAAAAPTWFDWLSLALTVIGFVVAFVQLRKTRASAEAAAAALEKAERRLLSDQTVALPGQLADVGYELTFVEEGGAPEVARFALLRLHALALESSSVIAALGEDQDKMSRKLERLGKRALAAKGELGGASDAADVVRPVNLLLSEIRGELSRLASEIRNRVSSHAADN